MKTASKVIIALCLAAICAGGAYAHRVVDDAKYETVVYHERVRSGDTFNSIIQQYYNHDNERDSWDEWQTKTKQRNKRLLFYANGKPRYLAAGDIVCIEVRERVQK